MVSNTRNRIALFSKLSFALLLSLATLSPSVASAAEGQVFPRWNNQLSKVTYTVGGVADVDYINDAIAMQYYLYYYLMPYRLDFQCNAPSCTSSVAQNWTLPYFGVDRDGEQVMSYANYDVGNPSEGHVLDYNVPLGGGCSQFGSSTYRCAVGTGGSGWSFIVEIWYW